MRFVGFNDAKVNWKHFRLARIHGFQVEEIFLSEDEPCHRGIRRMHINAFQNVCSPWKR